eukprot:UN29764
MWIRTNRYSNGYVSIGEERLKCMRRMPQSMAAGTGETTKTSRTGIIRAHPNKITNSQPSYLRTSLALCVINTELGMNTPKWKTFSEKENINISRAYNNYLLSGRFGDHEYHSGSVNLNFDSMQDSNGRNIVMIYGNNNDTYQNLENKLTRNKKY